MECPDQGERSVNSCKPLNPWLHVLWQRVLSGAEEGFKQSWGGLGSVGCPASRGSVCLLLAGQAKEMPQTHIQGCWDAVSTLCLYVPDYFSVFMTVSLGLLSSVQGCFLSSDKGSASKGAGDKSTQEKELDLLFSPWKHDWH